MVEQTVPSTGLPKPKSNSATGNLLPDDTTRAGPLRPRTIFDIINPGDECFIQGWIINRREPGLKISTVVRRARYWFFCGYLRPCPKKLAEGTCITQCMVKCECH